ncbi:MAG: glycosyltransferase family 4 protein [Desulfovibrio sp.]|nr:glycosyltransferase family 4 protein [Desulfovibrio sp.]
MPPRLFLSTHPFFESGSINGRKQANSGFMRTLFDLDPFDEYHFFVDNARLLSSLWQPLSELRAFRRAAVHAHSVVELPQALASTRFHVCHLSDPIESFVRLALCRNRLSPHIFPITAHNHTLSYVRYASSFQEYCWNGWSHADVIGCNSSSAKRVLSSFLTHFNTSGHMIPSLKVMPMGADVPDTEQNADNQRLACRKRLGVPDNAILALCFGRFSAVDKLDPLPLLFALRRARRLCPQIDIRLLFSGASSGEDSTYSVIPLLAKHFGLPVNVLPNPSEEEKGSVYAAADIFVSPSDNIQETFGLALVEAFAAGLPVIASDWDGYRDIVEHGITGFLIPTMTPYATPDLDLDSLLLFDNHYHYLRAQSTCVDVDLMAKALALLSSDDQFRTKMGLAGRQMVKQKFSWKVCVERWVRLWDELCSQSCNEEEERRLRSSTHPLFLPYGKIFSVFASSQLSDTDRLFLTELGNMFLHHELPWESLCSLRFGVSEEHVRPLLIAARKTCTLSQLLKKSRLPRHLAERHVLWCLKHDLLEREHEDIHSTLPDTRHVS